MGNMTSAICSRDHKFNFPSAYSRSNVTKAIL